MTHSPETVTERRAIWRRLLEHREPGLIVSVVSGLALLFLLGVWVGIRGYPPAGAVRSGWAALVLLRGELPTLLHLRPEHYLRPARYEGSGVTRSLPARPIPGFTLISGFFEGGNQLRLVRLDGSVVQRWPVEFSRIIKTKEHIRPEEAQPQSDWNVYTHGAVLLADGSIVFDFEYGGLVKLDRCGRVVWTLPRMTHHQVTPASDGSYWVPSQRYVEKDSAFPPLKAPYIEDTLLHVAADGKVLSETSLLRLFFANGLQTLLLANGLKGAELASHDVTHLNDVEELPAALAGKFSGFAPGDLLLSLRGLNLLMVVDSALERIKWHQFGSWLRQHDPDFAAGGRILLFDNANDGTASGTVLGGSRILELDPQTGQTRTVYGREPGQRFYTDVRGMQQALDGGHLLITEAEAGRVFEVDEAGQVVWEYVNRFDEKTTAMVSLALRYPESYFSVKRWACP